MLRTEGRSSRFGGITAGMILTIVSVIPANAQVDRTRYMPIDEIRPGMKGFGRTVMSGTEIETFNVEVLAVMRNAWYARKDVILIRCSGLNLEHSGIIAGMSGSPCYVRDEAGNERLIGAVAYGWSFSKDPICGLQPITQMIDIPKVRAPSKSEAGERKPTSAADIQESNRALGAGVPIGEILARAWPETIPPASRFSVFCDPISAAHSPPEKQIFEHSGLCSLKMPVMISSVTDRTMALLRDRFDQLGLIPVVSGGPTPEALADAENVKLEPGSVLCVPLMTGDIRIDATGTCTEVMGNQILGFGHSFFGEGSVELPLATGIIHTTIPSVMRSSKIGAALKTVGTLWGDETSGIFGICGRAPAMIPLEVVVADLRGRQAYHYELVQNESLTSMLIGAGLLESIYNNSDLPREHTIRYSIETEFEKLGAFRTTNLTSQNGVFGLVADAILTIGSMMNAPFEKAKLERARVEVTIEDNARAAQIDQATLPKTIYKPGQTVTVRVRWFHFRRDPNYTQAEYNLTLPKDLPDGEYELSIGSANAHLQALRAEKPHLFRVHTLGELLETFNRIGSFPENRVYMRLKLKTGGLAINRIEMPELPSFYRQIFTESKRTDVHAYTDALLVQHETDFVTSGEHSFKIQVSRRADQ